jgi:hypothetical protein
MSKQMKTIRPQKKVVNYHSVFQIETMDLINSYRVSKGLNLAGWVQPTSSSPKNMIIKHDRK